MVRFGVFFFFVFGSVLLSYFFFLHHFFLCASFCLFCTILSNGSWFGFQFDVTVYIFHMIVSFVRSVSLFLNEPHRLTKFWFRFFAHTLHSFWYISNVFVYTNHYPSWCCCFFYLSCLSIVHSLTQIFYLLSFFFFCLICFVFCVSCFSLAAGLNVFVSMYFGCIGKKRAIRKNSSIFTITLTQCNEYSSNTYTISGHTANNSYTHTTLKSSPWARGDCFK